MDILDIEFIYTSREFPRQLEALLKHSCPEYGMSSIYKIKSALAETDFGATCVVFCVKQNVAEKTASGFSIYLDKDLKIHDCWTWTVGIDARDVAGGPGTITILANDFRAACLRKLIGETITVNHGMDLETFTWLVKTAKRAATDPAE